MLKNLLAPMIVLMIMLMGCTAPARTNEQPQIVATIFPQYDFARVIVGDKADVILLLPPGVESHTYQPTSSEVIAVENADLFIYSGESLEPWAKNFQTNNALDISQNVPREDDPHIWTNPNNAKIMIDNILRELCVIDPENADYYLENAAEYKQQLAALDERFSQIPKGKIIFAGENPMHYFLEQYDFPHDAAIDSCNGESEPAAKAVARIISDINEQGISAIFYTELSSPSLADAITRETGAIPMLLHSCHNVSKAEKEAGETYLTLMNKNAETLEAVFSEGV